MLLQRWSRVHRQLTSANKLAHHCASAMSANQRNIPTQQTLKLDKGRVCASPDGILIIKDLANAPLATLHFALVPMCTWGPVKVTRGGSGRFSTPGIPDRP